MADDHDKTGAVRIGGNPTAGGWVPQPDPTTLTTAIVDTAKTDLRRELAAQRELLETRLEAAEASVDRNRHAIDNLPNRLAEQTAALHVELDRRIGALSHEDEDIRREIIDQITHSERLQSEKFLSIGQQFTERDVRSDQDKKSSKEALDAALLAQKESVSQQNDANTTAATKSETSFTKQIDQIGTLIATLEKSLTDRITELKERIDRGEGGSSGVAGERASTRDKLGLQIATSAAFISLIVAVVAVIGLIVKR